jgi:hypothetical protein
MAIKRTDRAVERTGVVGRYVGTLCHGKRFKGDFCAFSGIVALWRQTDGVNSFIAKSFSSAKVFRLAGYFLLKVILRDVIIFARLNFV